MVSVAASFKVIVPTRPRKSSNSIFLSNFRSSTPRKILKQTLTESQIFIGICSVLLRRTRMRFNSCRSADSGSKSKRSFNSMSSNRSGDSDDSKKKKTTQKTLGTAWGSNSRSSSRSSFRHSPFSDFGSYMTVKNQKLQDQFEAEATSSSNSGSSRGKPIFQGVSIFVDGFTVPSSQELKGYMLKHGGRFENYFSRHHVTHIICSNLPHSKIKNLRSFSAGLPVVKPAWLLDSVGANKLLSWLPYQLDQVAGETHNQPKLLSFFALKSGAVSKDSTTYVSGEESSEIEDPSLKCGTIKEADSSGPCGYTDHSKPCSRDRDDSVHGNSTSVISREVTCNDGKFGEGNFAEPSNGLALDKGSVDDLDQPSPCRPSASVISDNAKKSTSSAISGQPKQHHSTLVDPNFVENYFKKSRLHFIGTWRSRYRKRFPSSKYRSPNVNASARRTFVIHVDMDCFFVSVVIRNHPELRDKPVAVCHSDNPRGTAEISSANYPARDYGVRAGIFVRDAKARCPHLTIFPYDFEAYEEVADQLYNILHKHCNTVQAVSCDEAFLEVTDLEVEDPQFLASVIRKEILETTGCTASAGISGNLLMARLATKAAKPDGQCYIPPEKVDDYLNELPIKSLPGIGHVLEEKLKRKQIQTCDQLRMISKESLQKEFGVKTGDMLWNYSRGIDNRLVGVLQESKSVGAEVNWGVRFNDVKDCQHFLMNLCKEVSLRLQGCAVEGRTFTLKIKKRRNDAEEPVKYMGCGDCENLSHSMTVPMATDDVDIIRRITTQLFGSFHIDVKDIRGMGLQVSKLESVDTAKQGLERNSIRSWLTSASGSSKQQREIGSPAKESASREIDEEHIEENQGRLSTDLMGPSVQIGTNPSNPEALLNQDLALPALGDLDLVVVESLPPDLFSEINDIYGGKLINLMSKKKGKTVAQEREQVSLKEGDGPFCRDPACVNENCVDKEEKYPVDKIQLGPLNVGMSTEVPNKLDLMPSSLSQVDTSVLQQLPEELRTDILQLLPAHRQPECASVVNLDPPSAKDLLCLKSHENQASVSSEELWAGNPPEWVAMFKHSNYYILRILADMYYRSGSTGRLSAILQCTLSESQPLVDPSNDGWDDAIRCLCDLFKQYIKLRVETDIEEIYVCFRLLKRFTTKSKLLSQVYNVIFPHLQATVGESYGGSLHISDGKD